MTSLRMKARLAELEQGRVLTDWSAKAEIEIAGRVSSLLHTEPETPIAQRIAELLEQASARAFC